MSFGGEPPFPYAHRLPSAVPEGQFRLPSPQSPPRSRGGGGGVSLHDLPNPISLDPDTAGGSSQQPPRHPLAPLPAYRTSEPTISIPPSPLFRQSVADTGSCSPHIFRMSLNGVPRTTDFLNKCGMCFCGILSPLSQSCEIWRNGIPGNVPRVNLVQEMGSNVPRDSMSMSMTTTTGTTTTTSSSPFFSPPLHQSQTAESSGRRGTTGPQPGTFSPIRCGRCRAYINPYVEFLDAGNAFRCNMCEYRNIIPSWYFCHVDAVGKRTDVLQRPELRYGTVDYVVQGIPEYDFGVGSNQSTGVGVKNQEQRRMVIAFVVDVGVASRRQALFQTVLSTLEAIGRIPIQGRKGTQDGANPVLPKDARICVITYARAVHLYRLRKRSPEEGGEGEEQDREPTGSGSVTPEVLVVGDLSKETFLPCVPEEVIVPFEEFHPQIDLIVSKMAKMAHSVGDDQDNCMGSALLYAAHLIRESGAGGKIMLFSSKYPTLGVGSGVPLPSVVADALEPLFAPKVPLWKECALAMAENSISVDLFLFPEAYSTYLNSGALASIPKLTTGHLYIYSKFNYSKDLGRLYADIQRCLCRERGYDGVLRVRCSQGFSVGRYLGHFFRRKTTPNEEIDLANIDSDVSFGVEFVHDYPLDDVSAFVQAALLYTSRGGQRRVRVMTLRLGVVDELRALYRHSCLNAEMRFWTMDCVEKIAQLKMTLEGFREMCFHRCVELLAKYRKHLSSQTGKRELVLPDSLRFMPLYSVCLVKCPAFRAGGEIPLDQRIRAFVALGVMSTRNFLAFLFPRLYSLHDLPAIPEGVEELDFLRIRPLPTQLSPSAAQVSTHGLYLLQDGLESMIYVGQDCPTTLVRTVLGHDFKTLQSATAKLTVAEDSAVGRRVLAILRWLSSDCYQNGTLLIFKETDPQRQFFFTRLPLDQNAHYLSYVAFVCKVHEDIQQKLQF